MIDSHCHFDLSAFDNKRNNTLIECAKAGVTRLLVPGLSIAQFPKLIELSEERQRTSKAEQENFPQLALPHIDIALGLHPYFMGELNNNELHHQHKQLLELGAKYKDKIVAVGECGLDASLALPMGYQEHVFKQQIELAQSLNKPLIVHHRKSHNELIRLIKNARFKQGGVIHAFSGSEHIANTYIDLGFKLGVGGTITYERAVKTRHTISQTPIEHLLLETDAPDMPIQGYQGQMNTPARLPLVASALACLQGCEVSEVVSQTTINYSNTFLATEAN
ncbi:TatD family hydrolase [Glaciecola sp. 2405UD65-10]|uniref:TatD family hydrolase n=1 Tax=Glaciecola sp. 2405UD65-10 TaxID=3397244 RepID=UPI003B5AD402